VPVELTIDLNRLFKLRAAVGRYGEMDAAGWWNTQGVLGSRGASVYKRSLPRTHLFARVRLVTHVARSRSSSIYPAPGVATLWSLPAELERSLSFEERAWATNGSEGEWAEFEAAVASSPNDDLGGWLTSLDLLEPELAKRGSVLPLAPGEKGVEVPGPVTDEAIQLLSAAHARGAQKNLVVPFIPGGVEITGG
jgi:hypothetical protein